MVSYRTQEMLSGSDFVQNKGDILLHVVLSPPSPETELSALCSWKKENARFRRCEARARQPHSLSAARMKAEHFGENNKLFLPPNKPLQNTYYHMSSAFCFLYLLVSRFLFLHPFKPRFALRHRGMMGCHVKS